VRIGKLNWPVFAIAAFVLLLAINYYSIQRKKVRHALPIGDALPQVSIAATHGVIIASDGSLWSWGSDFLGWPVLGTAGVTNQTALRRVGHDHYWASVSAGTSHNLAITKYGTLWAWGENIRHQVDDSAAPSRDHPVPSVPGNDWQQAAAGGTFSIALKKNGTLWAWGDNWAGQLGIGSTNDSALPVQMGIATNWTKVWAGNANGMGLQNDSSLWIWGDNPALANQQARSAKNLLSPTRVSSDTNWVEAAFASQAFLALKSDGTLWIWGRYASNYTRVNNQADVPNRLGTNNDWQSISSSEWARDLYIVLRKRDGTIWTMESSIASGGTIKLTQVPLQKEIAVVAGGGGGEHGVQMMHDGICTGLAVARDGEVWVWGRSLGYTPPFVGLQGLTGMMRRAHIDVHWGDPHPIARPLPELLPAYDQKN